MTKWPYPSATQPDTTYYVVLSDDGKLSCDCRGWLIRKKDKPRQCRHTEDVAKRNNFTLETQGEFQYVIANDLELPLAHEPSLIDYGEHYKDATTEGYVQPMLASAMTKRGKDETWEQTIQPYKDGQWVSEVKYDGERCIIAKGNGKVLAWSRPKDATVGKPRQLPPHIHDFVKKCLPDGTFDSEDIVGMGGKSYDVKRIGSEHMKQLAIFDALKLSGQELFNLPLSERRVLLKQALANCKDDSPVFLAPQYEPSAEQVLSLWSSGNEGVILKRITSIYRPGWRSPDWIKIKMEGYVTCTLTGFEAAKNGPYSKIKGISTEGVEVSCKAKDNAMLKAFEEDHVVFFGRRFVLKHYGPTPAGKYRGPTIFDHWAGEGE